MTEQHSSDWLGLSGSVAVVTGGGGGIGRATAVSFARAGARVAALDRDERGLAETKAKLREFGDGHLVASCDTTSEDNVAAAADAVARTLGPSDILVNTAAVLRPGGLDTLPLAEWNAVLAVNLTGYFICAQAFGRQMRQGRTRQSHPRRLDRRQQCAGAERRLQRQQGRCRDALAATRR
ncbi:SDR family oxidoreductase [Bradyrhizobium quebecense]|uniref:SDR family NAD(P)-dependent oxidoreductase n=1 Tax=Bradyrhizobium quebecense TaxID=2748629 RepID=UPI001F341A33|nr:SDR family oxidoreductase [Bradyrhizobium quebecense]UGA41766.1 SDR family oxidoreductase [Bradyrhizobium quebecense]